MKQIVILIAFAAISLCVVSARLDIDRNTWDKLSLKEKTELEDRIEDEEPDLDDNWDRNEIYPEHDYTIEDPLPFGEAVDWVRASDKPSDVIDNKFRNVELNPDTVVLDEDDHEHIVVTKLPIKEEEMDTENTVEDGDDVSSDTYKPQKGVYTFVKRDRVTRDIIEDDMPGVVRIKDFLLRSKGITIGSILVLFNGIFRVGVIGERDPLGYHEIQCQRSTLDRTIKHAEWSHKVDNISPVEMADDDDSEDEATNFPSIPAKHANELRQTYIDLEASHRRDKLELVKGKVMEIFDSQIPKLGEEVEDKQRRIYDKTIAKSKKKLENAMNMLTDLADAHIDSLVKMSTKRKTDVLDDDAQSDEIEDLDDGWGRVTRFFRRIGRGIKRFVRRAYRAVKNGVKKAWRAIKKVGKFIWDKFIPGPLKSVLRVVGKFAKYTIGKLVEITKKLVKAVYTFLKSLMGIIDFNLVHKIGIGKEVKDYEIINKTLTTSRKGATGSLSVRLVVKHAKILAEAGAVFKGSIKFFRLKFMEAYFYGKFEFIIKALIQLTAKYEKENKKKVATWKKYFTFFIGPIPVVIKFYMDMFAGVLVRIKARFDSLVGYEYRYSIKIGVGYKNGKFHKIWEKKKVKKYYKPKTDVCLNIYAEAFIKAELGALFYTINGPTFSLQPYISFELIGNGSKQCSKPKPEPELPAGEEPVEPEEEDEDSRETTGLSNRMRSMDEIEDANTKVPSYWELRLGLKAFTGITFKLFGRNIGSKEFQLFNKSFPLASGCWNLGLTCTGDSDSGRLNQQGTVPKDDPVRQEKALIGSTDSDSNTEIEDAGDEAIAVTDPPTATHIQPVKDTMGKLLADLVDEKQKLTLQSRADIRAKISEARSDLAKVRTMIEDNDYENWSKYGLWYLHSITQIATDLKWKGKALTIVAKGEFGPYLVKSSNIILQMCANLLTGGHRMMEEKPSSTPYPLSKPLQIPISTPSPTPTPSPIPSSSSSSSSDDESTPTPTPTPPSIVEKKKKEEFIKKIKEKKKKEEEEKKKKRKTVCRKECKCPVSRPTRKLMHKMEKDTTKPAKKNLDKAAEKSAEVIEKAKRTIAGIKAARAKKKKEGKLSDKLKKIYSKIEQQAKDDIEFAKSAQKQAKSYKEQTVKAADKQMKKAEKAMGVRDMVKAGKKRGKKTHCKCQNKIKCIQLPNVIKNKNVNKLIKKIEEKTEKKKKPKVEKKVHTADDEFEGESFDRMHSTLKELTKDEDVPSWYTGASLEEVHATLDVLTKDKDKDEENLPLWFAN